MCVMASGLLLDVCSLILTNCNFSDVHEDKSDHESGMVACFCMSDKERMGVEVGEVTFPGYN